VISQRLETIPGVSGVQIWGQNDTLCDCGLILKLASYGLTVAEVRTARKTERRITFRKIDRANTELTVKLLETYLLPKNLII
jgi:HAE1 family hydrophobic/amphiphilic exporter-1/multidrug efflux pump